MEIKNGALGYTLTLDNKQVQQILAQTRADFARTNEYAIAEMNKVQSKMSDIKLLGGSFLSVAAAKGFVTELIHVRGEFQQIENAIETITGSQDKMNTLMTEWKDLTLRSPFRLSEIAQSGKQLLAYGVEVEKVTDDIEMLGNIASGVSAPINDIAYLYGTLKTQGRAYQQDINQFTGRGIPIIKELAKQFGVAESEVRAMTEAGKIGFPEVEKALHAMTSEGGQFFNLIGKQATTLTGAVNRLKHEIELMFNEIGADSEGLLSGGINVVTHLVENYKELGKTLGVLITTYGAYKAAVMVTNTIEQIRTTTTLALGVAEGRVTTIQGLRYLATLKLTAAQTALNAVMMANPYAIIIAGAVALGTAYYLLSDNTTSAQRAQEAYNKTQEEVKSKLDETKKKADEYINTLKDETATVYQQIQAYNALQALKLKGLENLTQEQIATMDLTELRKLLNASYDEKGLSSQKKALEGIGEQIKEAKNNLKIYNETIANGGKISQSTLNEANKRVETLNREYDLQASKVRKVEEELKISNMTLGEQKSYYEGIVQELQNKVNEIRKVNEQQADSKNAADLVASAFAQWDISKLNFQLNDAYSKIYEINDQINKTGPIVKDKSYWENEKKTAEDSLSKLDPTDPRNKKEWQELTTRITKAKDSLKSWDVEATKVTKPKKPKTPKKSDDPVEIFKKQVQGMKDEYDRYVNYMNSDDIVLKATAEAISLRIKNKGANYEEYLRNVQKQLANVTNKTKDQVKELQYVNDELAKIIDYNAFDKYKEGINEQVDSSENLLKVIGLLEEEKQKFANSTDQIDKDKFKFLDEKEIDIIKKTDDAAKSLIKTLTEEANPLDTINKKFDEEIELLKYKLEKAQTDIEKQKIQVSIEQVETKRKKALEDTPTNNAEVNEILKKYQTLEQKKQQIKRDSDNEIKKLETEMFNEVDSEKIANYTATIEEIKTKQKEALQAVDSEILKKSDDWVKVFEDYSNKSSKQISSLIKDIEAKLSNKEFTKNLKADELKALQDRLMELKRSIGQDDPFTALSNSVTKLIANFKKADGSINFEGIRESIGNAKNAINETLSLAEDLGINISDSTRDAVELGANLFEAGTQIAEGIATNNPVQAVQGVIKAVTSIFKANDKKKQRQIKRYQQAIDDLARSFKNLQYETSKALGSDAYKDQRAMLDNLTQQQNEYRKMIQTEQRRKKTDQGKIKEWQQAIVEIDQAKQDLLDSLAQDVLQTNAKDLASTLGDALVEAFGKGEDAAKSFEKVANDVLKNAVLNQLKNQFLEKDLQKALDQLYKDMGADNQGNFNFDGLSQAEQQKFKDAIKQISQNFSGALEMYSDLFKDLETDPNQNSLSGAIAGVSEETASIISGQMNAVRILIADANKQRDLSNKILLQQLDRLANIDYNTKSVLPLLERLINRIDNAGRAYGF
ncbi:tape measure protein [Chishuiella sp.]|uniref:tape measure protein n=1 Tax=Chishuiella sp. TaxID=1969467 RepID=UPI0028AF9526|nr:tape measure protein [Chishuiella sp.]